MSKEAEGNNRSRRAINIGILLRSKKRGVNSVLHIHPAFRLGLICQEFVAFFLPRWPTGKKKNRILFI